LLVETPGELRLQRACAALATMLGDADQGHINFFI
jgi:hypothetical protein